MVWTSSFVQTSLYCNLSGTSNGQQPVRSQEARSTNAHSYSNCHDGLTTTYNCQPCSYSSQASRNFIRHVSSTGHNKQCNWKVVSVEKRKCKFKALTTSLPFAPLKEPRSHSTPFQQVPSHPLADSSLTGPGSSSASSSILETALPRVPGRDFMMSFLKRHKKELLTKKGEILKKTVSNKKSACTIVTPVEEVKLSVIREVVEDQSKLIGKDMRTNANLKVVITVTRIPLI